MKVKPVYFIILFCFVSVQSCWFFNEPNDFVTIEPVDFYEPVIMQRSDFETTTTLQTTPEAIVNSGKIYVRDNYIFINEVNKGFHIIDNSDAMNPENIGFLSVLGSSDLTIKGASVYVNNATDLLALTIDPETGTMEITKRVPNAFPQIRSPFGSRFYDLNENEIIVDWVIENVNNENS